MQEEAAEVAREEVAQEVWEEVTQEMQVEVARQEETWRTQEEESPVLPLPQESPLGAPQNNSKKRGRCGRGRKWKYRYARLNIDMLDWIS